MEPLFIIGDHNWQQHAGQTVINGERKAKGAIPRPWDKAPAGSYRSARAVTYTPHPRSEWAQRIKDKEDSRSRISDVLAKGDDGKPIPSTDQNGQGYCWMYSCVFTIQALRALAHLPYVKLSGHGAAWKVKKGRDEGGWCAESLDFVTANGIPSCEFWPEKSMNGRQYDNAKTWENAALHKAVEAWVDLESAQYDRKLTFDQIMSLCMDNNPGQADFNWWGHSVGFSDAVNGATQRNFTRSESGKLLTLSEFDLVWGMETDTGGYGLKIRNSWTDGWGTNGYGVLTGTKAIPDGAVAAITTTPSLA